jgi:hypothetical protein
MLVNMVMAQCATACHVIISNANNSYLKNISIKALEVSI